MALIGDGVVKKSHSLLSLEFMLRLVTMNYTDCGWTVGCATNEGLGERSRGVGKKGDRA